MQTIPPFPLNRLAEIQAEPDNFRLLERVPLTRPGITFPIELSESDKTYPFAVLDVETTGMNHQTDKIIELGIVTGQLSLSTGRLVRLDGVYSFYEDPGRPIPPEITEITGITDEMVSGQKIDDAMLARIIPPDALYIAHNASFDRPFFEKRIIEGGHDALQHVLNAPWACSISDIDWYGMGYKSRSLEILLLAHGFFYTAHRASIDTLATAWLLHRNTVAQESLWAAAKSESYIVRALNSPFECKDALKSRGYTWNDGSGPNKKHWWIKVKAADLEAEKDFLNGLYHRGGSQAEIIKQTARTRYKAS